MAGGRPAIATRVGDVPSVLDDGTTGWLLAERTAAELGRVLRLALENPHRLHEMGRLARRRVEERHSAAAMAAAYAEIYRGVLGFK
jgi:L-malate glycosyltransferase